MAISNYEKNGKTYYRVYIQERSSKDKTIRVQRSKAGLNSHEEARREEKRLVKEVFEAVAKIEAKGMTWKELVYRWERTASNGLLGKNYSQETIRDHFKTLYKHTYPWFGKRVKDLGRSDGRYLVNVLSNKTYSSSRIKAIKGSINKVWNWGVEESLIEEGRKSPVHSLLIESNKKKFKPILTLEEIKKLLLEAEIREHPWRDIWAVALLTGMRIGELFALTWDDIDFENNIIRVTKSYSSRINGVKSTKNAEWRNAHISEDLKEILLKLKNDSPLSQNVLPRLSGWNTGVPAKILRDFLARIGVNKFVTFHTLRACFATHVLASGAEPTQVMKMGGWADFKTFQIYIRMAGVDVKGVTDSFRVTPRIHSCGTVVKLKR